MTFDHIGMIVSTLEAGRAQLSQLFTIAEWTVEFTDPLNRVMVQFGRDASGVCYELIAPLGEDSPAARARKTGRDILNHVAYLVPDLASARVQMKSMGAMPITQPTPAVAYGGKAIQFFVTRTRFILELIEAPGHRHIYHN